jgi:hypothetical protein
LSVAKKLSEMGHDRSQVPAHQLGAALHGVRKGAEDDALLLELRPERRRDGDAVEDGIDGHAGEALLLGERDPELLVGA